MYYNLPTIILQYRVPWIFVPAIIESLAHNMVCDGYLQVYANPIQFTDEGIAHDTFHYCYYN